LLSGETDPDAHFDALIVRGNIDSRRGELGELIVELEQAFAIALAAGRKDLQTVAAQGLAQTHIVRLELGQAESLLERALELAAESGSIRAEGAAKASFAWLRRVSGDLEAAAAMLEVGRAGFAGNGP